MEQVLGILYLILGNQLPDSWLRYCCYGASALNFIVAFLESPLTKAFIKGFKGEINL